MQHLVLKSSQKNKVELAQVLVSKGAVGEWEGGPELLQFYANHGTCAYIAGKRLQLHNFH